MRPPWPRPVDNPVDNIINLRLLSHPLNWIIVWTVLAFAGFAYTLIHENAGPPTV